ncbi:MAG: hypothetical protein M1831_000956 [Alyxoria varia]|nr:MAG: hypothetical protein M1831_000956 [Alyxoria varia]
MFKGKRLSKELIKAQEKLPPGIALVSADNFNEWFLDIQVLDEENPIYKDKTFRLRLRFNDKYPIGMLYPCYLLTLSPAPQCQGETPTSTNAPSLTPTEPPQAHFLPSTTPPRPIPLHPHIYSNGIICLDLLGSGWSPVQNVESVSMSLQSMLTSNTKNERPEGDEEFCRRTNVGMDTRGLGFVYDDESV